MAAYHHDLDGFDPTAEAEVDATALDRETSQAPDLATMTRALRDLEAAKARVERDARQASDDMRAQLVMELLPVLDNLDRTIAAADRQGDAPAVAEGVRLVRSQFQRILEGYGVERIDARHQPFDPSQHEAINLVQVTHPASHGVVIDQLAPGYRFGDRLLRPAKVVVGRHTPRYHH